MSKKIKILIFIAIVVISILIITSTYSKYAQDAVAIKNQRIARWELSVNGTDITTEDAEFVIDDFEWDVNNSTHVKEPKIAPGVKGNFSLEVDPTDCDVSIKYDVSIDKTILTNLADINLAITSLKKNGVTIPTTEDASGNLKAEIIKPLSEIKSNDPSVRIDELEIEVTWVDENTPEANAEDSKVGAIPKAKMQLPVKFHAIQYTGD